MVVAKVRTQHALDERESHLIVPSTDLVQLKYNALLGAYIPLNDSVSW